MKRISKYLIIGVTTGAIWGLFSFFMSFGCGWQEGGWYLCSIKEIVYFPFQIIVILSKTIPSLNNLIPPFAYIPLAVLMGILIGALAGIVISAINIPKKR